MTKHKASLTLFLLMTLFVSCSTDRSMNSLSDSDLSNLERFKKFSEDNQLEICGDSEPGQRLMLCLTFISKEDKKALANHKVHLYHTSAQGEYQPSDINDETTARLNGYVMTNEKGEAFVETILPGDYGSSADNRHIHTTVPDARPTAYDIHFKQYTGRMGKNFIAGSDQHFLADLKLTDDSTLVAFVTIEAKQVSSQAQADSVSAEVKANETSTHIKQAIRTKSREESRRISYDSSLWSSSTTGILQDSVVVFATQFLGTPYKVAGQNANGFDCSGYVYYVYKHFNVAVPRSSKYYNDFGIEIPVEQVQKGDVLVFLSPTRNEIGHVGIVSLAAGAKSEFLHASSGKKREVITSNLKSRSYKKRFVKAVRVLPPG